VDEDLERAFKQITESVDAQQRRIQEFVQELDKSFTNAVDRLSGTITNISETTDDLQETLERWTQSGSGNGSGGDGARPQ
jgi:ABC-type transporter Mla subunit MlaD